MSTSTTTPSSTAGLSSILGSSHIPWRLSAALANYALGTLTDNQQLCNASLERLIRLASVGDSYLERQVKAAVAAVERPAPTPPPRDDYAALERPLPGGDANVGLSSDGKSMRRYTSNGYRAIAKSLPNVTWRPCAQKRGAFWLTDEEIDLVRLESVRRRRSERQDFWSRRDA